jgi:2-oxoglutarate dehydrogenase E1 component
VIRDAERDAAPADVRRLILCSGKIGIDLLTSPAREQARPVSVCRVEQLYPFPVDDALEAIDAYRSLQEIVWVQEEPDNMGAWPSVRSAIETLAGRRRVAVLARPASSSPAEGSAARHAGMQSQLIERALTAQLRPSTRETRS